MKHHLLLAATLVSAVSVGFAAGFFIKEKPTAHSSAIGVKNLDTTLLDTTLNVQEIATPKSDGISDTKFKLVVGLKSDTKYQLDIFATSLLQADHYSDLIAALDLVSNANESLLIESINSLNQSDVVAEFTDSVNAALYQRWAELDIDAALDFLIENIDTDSSVHRERLERGLHVVAKLQPEYVIPAIVLGASLSSGESRRVLLEVAGALDPELMVRSALSSNVLTASSLNTNETLAAALYHWGIKDPRGALEYLGDDPDGKSAHSSIRMEILLSWFEHDPDDALIAIEAQLSQGLQTDSMDNVELAYMYVSHLSKTDSASAFHWLQSQDNEVIKDAATDELSEQWAERDPQGLMNFVDQLDLEQKSNLLPAVMSALAYNVASEQLPQTLEWTAQLPTELRERAEFNLVNAWVNKDVDSVVTWLQQNPVTGDNQHIHDSATESIVEYAPEAAKRLFQQLEPGAQVNLTESMIFNLSEQSEKHALEWLDEQSNASVREKGYAVIESLFGY